MIVWSGKGILVAICLGLTLALFESLMNVDYPLHAVLGCFITALFALIMGRIWNNQAMERAIQIKQGEDAEPISLSTLFWIRMEYWFWILIIIGILIWTGVFD